MTSIDKNLDRETRLTAVTRLLNVSLTTSAKTVSAIAAVGAVYGLVLNNSTALVATSPVLAQLITAIGGDVLAGMLEKVANRSEISLTELEKLLEQIADQNQDVLRQQPNLPTKHDLYRVVSLLQENHNVRFDELGWQYQQISNQLEQLRQIVTAETKPVNVEQYLPGYLAWAKTMHDSMQVLTRKMPLTDIYTDVYMIDKQAYWSNSTKEERQAAFAQREPWVSRNRRAGVSLLADHRRLFIVGQPGAGKTTFMRWLTLQAAQGKLPFNTVPIYIKLHRFNSFEGGLVQLIAHQLNIGGWPDGSAAWEALRQSRPLLILLDGLDEVLAMKRKSLNDQIADLAQDKRLVNSYILITCRPHAETRQFEQFTYVKVADFTRNQAETFIYHWFSTQIDVAERLLAELGDKKHRAIRELIRTPLLLALLCIAYEEKPIFPTRRHELYQWALEKVLKEWDSTRGIDRESVYKKLGLEEKKNLLAWIAYSTFEQGQLFISKTKLDQHITTYWKAWRAAEIQKQIDEGGSVYDLGDIPPREVDAEKIIAEIASQHGLLVAQSHTDYSFSHLTLQEYFAALYIVKNETNGTLPRLMHHVGNERWRELFLLTAGMLSDATDFAEGYLHALDRMARQDEGLLALVQWSMAKSADSSGANTNPAVRAFYLYLAARGRDLEPDPVRDRARADAFMLEFSQDVANQAGIPAA